MNFIIVIVELLSDCGLELGEVETSQVVKILKVKEESDTSTADLVSECKEQFKTDLKHWESQQQTRLLMAVARISDRGGGKLHVLNSSFPSPLKSFT